MTSLIKASAVAQAIQAAIVVTVTPGSDGISSRDMRFFRSLADQIKEYLRNCDPVGEIGNTYESKPPAWLPESAHSEFWVVRLLNIPLKNSARRIIVDLRFADGVRGYTLQQVRFCNDLKVSDWRTTPVSHVIPASNFTTRSLIECCFEEVEKILLNVYKNDPALQPKGTASLDKVIESLQSLVEKWEGNDAPDWQVYKQGSNQIRVDYDLTFRRSSFMDEWTNNSKVRNAGARFVTVISEAKRLNADIKVVEEKPLTKQGVQKLEDWKDQNGDSSYSEYEQSMGGYLVLQL
ncbi:hypothetical protein KFS98_003670 [Salmonella enterica]|nr:hypothetical protein [Salmonella enterica]